MSKVIDVVAYTNGKVVWINSDRKNEVRICGLDKLKGMKPVKTLLSEQEGSVDVTILGNKLWKFRRKRR